MKRAFTLVELLVTVTVIVILAALVFRLGGISGEQSKTTQTVFILQKLENCLSGYYAAFGNYPPVQLHGSRNIYCRLNMFGIQLTDRPPAYGVIDWRRVEAACRSQPVAMNYPFEKCCLDTIDEVSAILKEKHDSGEDRFAKNPLLAYLFDGIRNPGMLDSKRHKSEWTEIQLFRFGLMSFLTPRYVTMLRHKGEGWDDEEESEDDLTIYDDFAQWGNQNQLPCRFENGLPYNSWEELAREPKWKLMLLPSQAVTERWAPNLEGILSDFSSVVTENNPNPIIYSASEVPDEKSMGSQYYVLNGVTCRDAWENELYYYSKPPYQSYRIWSAGPNGKTFAPWIPDESLKDLSPADRKLVQEWMSDDIVKMKQ